MLSFEINQNTWPCVIYIYISHTAKIPDNERCSFIAFKNDDRLSVRLSLSFFLVRFAGRLSFYHCIMWAWGYVCVYVCVCVYSILSIKCKSQHEWKMRYRWATLAHHWIVHTNELMLPRHANNRSGEPNQTYYMCMCIDALLFTPSSLRLSRSFTQSLASIHSFY